MDRQWEELKVENICRYKDKPYEAGEDIKDFLWTFERTVVLQGIQEDEWVRQPLLLCGQSWAASNSVDARVEYTEIKQAILARFEAYN